MKSHKSFLVIFLVLIVIVLISYPLSQAVTINTEEGESSESSSTEPQLYDTTSDANTAGSGTYTEASGSVEDNTYEPASYEPPQEDVEISSVSEDTNIVTSTGTISSFSMTNALFSLGSLIQGSFISFTNNNNLYFGSLFDASTFTATLDNGSSLQVGQRSSFGDMGKVVIQIEGSGNLTQDDKLTFTPNSETAMYTYYNTTQIEFQEGNLSYYGESIINNYQEKESTTVSFDEDGFTKVKLNPKDSYTNRDFFLENTGDDPLIICKKDPLCDVNIDEETFTVQGKVNVSSKGNLIYQSNDKNNEAVLDFTTGAFTLNNPLPQEDTLSIFYNGHVQLTETQDNIYFLPQENRSTNDFKTYTSILQDKTLSLEDNTIGYKSFSAFLPESSLYQSCLDSEESCIVQKEESMQQAPEKEATPSYYSLGAFFLILVLAFFFLPKRKKKNKKGQFTLFVALGLVLIISIILVFVFSQKESTATEITKIESLEDARLAVESCITETIEKDLKAFGEHGGYITENQYSFSRFNTTYDLLSLEELQENLETGMERSLNDCSKVLENTPYNLIPNGRIHLQGEFSEEIKIMGDSLGTITTEDGTQSTSIAEIKQIYAVNIPEIYSLTQELMNSKEGILILSTEKYIINIFSSEDYTEELIEVHQKETGFIFKITRR